VTFGLLFFFSSFFWVTAGCLIVASLFLTTCIPVTIDSAIFGVFLVTAGKEYDVVTHRGV
jgi:hypothetical protein